MSIVLVTSFALFGGAAQTGQTKAEKVPLVTAGPDLEADATVVDAPVAAVTVFSDRARVRRVKEVPLAAGINTLRLPDLPGAALLDTLRVSATDAKLLRVEAAPVERERISIAAVEAALTELEKKTDQRLGLEARLRVLRDELTFLGDLAPRPPAEERYREGKPILPLSLDAQRLVLDLLGQRRATIRADLRKLEEEHRVVSEAMAQLRRSVALRDLGAFTAQTIRVLAIVDAKAATRSKLTLEYFIPGATWTPAYDLHYYAKDARLEVATYGLVTQATGEDWSDVALELSTAIPGQGIDLPELLTWTLGEKGEWLPRPQPATFVTRPPFAAPAPTATEKELTRAIEVEQLSERLAALDALASGGPVGLPKPAPREKDRAPSVAKGRSYGAVVGSAPVVKKMEQSIEFDDDTISGDLTRPDGLAMEPAPSMAQPSAPMMDVAETTVAISSESTRRTSSGPSYRRTNLALFESGSATRMTFSDPRLPAVLAGGLDYVYPAASRFTVPSTADRLRVPLTVERYPVTVYYEATPSLAPSAFLKATVENKSDKPLLAGPAAIFVGNDFAGDGALRTTGPGGTIELPLGADEDLRFVRKVVPETKTEGVFSKDDITTYRTEVEVGNYKKRPVRVLVLDQVPKTNQEDVEVKLLATAPNPSDPPNADGLMRFDLTIPAGETRKIVFTYSVKRPSGWRLQQN